jgi:Glycine cleavage H-protein
MNQTTSDLYSPVSGEILGVNEALIGKPELVNGVITPPQINKYYATDLRFLLDGGIQTFAVSWRNPDRRTPRLGLDTYIAALDRPSTRFATSPALTTYR